MTRAADREIKSRFQSTPPVKAATGYTDTPTDTPAISIHAAREGGDATTNRLCAYVSRFQSTPPVKAATMQIITARISELISIHAAREGGDPAPGASAS